MDAFDQFHYGQLVHQGKPKGDARILAQTGGIDEKLINAALEMAVIPPLERTTGIAWGIIRLGRGQPLVLTRAEVGEAGQLTRQYVFIPSEVIRALAGNLVQFLPFVSEPLPVYQMLGDNLPKLKLAVAEPPTTEQQVDSLLNLMSYTKNQTRNIDPLLSAVVSGVPLIVFNAPHDAKKRLGFIQGMLALLPASTRHGVTFLLNDDGKAELKAQISFREEAPEDDGEATIYDWQSAKTTGKDVKTDYSRFITGQLRLDAELVIQQTEKLTRTAGWRFQAGDSLGEALDYASYRSKVDRSVENNLPVEIESVAKILKEDPTLNDETRLQYARHLMNFSLALEDMDHIAPVTPTIQSNPAFAREVYDQLRDAVGAGKGALIFELLVTWMNDPLSPQGPQWTQLLHQSALAELAELVEDKDTESLRDYLLDIQSLGRVATPLISKILRRIMLLLERDSQLSVQALILAIQHLSDNELRKWLQLRQFVAALPQDVKRLLGVMTRRDVPAPPGTMMKAMAHIPEDMRDQTLITFVKYAHLSRRYDVLDRAVWQQVVQLMVQSAMSEDDKSLMAEIAQAVSDGHLKRMKDPLPRLLLQVQLLGKRIDLLTSHLIVQARDFYGADRQLDYIRNIQVMFSKSRMNVEQAKDALKALENNGIRDIPLLAAMSGALEGTSWSPEMRPLADRFLNEVLENPGHVEVLAPQTMMNLLKYYARFPKTQAQLKTSLRLAASCAASQSGKLGLSSTNHAYKMLNSNNRTRPLALELVRQYVREADEKPARHLMNYYSDRLGENIREKLQMSYEFANMLGRMDFLTYAAAVRTTVELLQNTVETFENKQAIPDLMYLRRQAETFRNGTSIAQLYDLSRELRQVAHSIVILGEQHSRRSNNSDRFIQQVVEGSQDPKSMVDVFRAAGGNLLDKKVYPLRLKGEGNDRPFGTGSAYDRLTNITLASTVLQHATQARPSNRQMWPQAAIADELASLKNSLVEPSARDAARQLGRDWQRLADLIVYITDKSDTKVIENGNNLGNRLQRHEVQPSDPLQMYRFIYGYFAP